MRINPGRKTGRVVVRTSPFTTDSAYRALEAEGLVRYETDADGTVHIRTTDKGRQIAEEVQAAQEAGEASVRSLQPVVKRILSGVE